MTSAAQRVPRPAAQAEPLPRPGGTAPELGEPSRPLVAYTVAVMVLGTGAFAPLAPGSIQALVFPLWVVAYAVAAAGLLDLRIRLREQLRAPLSLVVFAGLAVASVLWSVAPALSMRRSVGLVGTLLVGLFLARKLRPLDLLDALRRAILIIAVASLLLYLTGSPLALDEIHGTLRGVVATKNTLGRLLALGILAAACVALLDRTRLCRCVVSGLVMVVPLALTDSTGGAAVTVLSLVTAVTIGLWGARSGRMLLVGTATLMLGILCFVVPGLTAEGAAGAIGEDTTLTGRTDIWSESLVAAAERPLLGYGYGAFWHEDGAVEATRIQARLQWPVPSAHNGVLDIALDLGVVGAGVALVAIGSLLVRGVLDARASHQELAVLRLAVAGLTIASNAVETGLLQQNTVPTLLLVAALAVRKPAASRPPSDERTA